MAPKSDMRHYRNSVRPRYGILRSVGANDFLQLVNRPAHQGLEKIKAPARILAQVFVQCRARILARILVAHHRNLRGNLREILHENLRAKHPLKRARQHKIIARKPVRKPARKNPCPRTDFSTVFVQCRARILARILT